MSTAGDRSAGPARHGGGAGLAAITVTAVLWGTTGTAATFAPEAGPLAIGSAALGIGGLLQALIALPALRAAWHRLRARWPLVVVGAAAVVGYPLAFYSSMHVAGVAIGTAVSLASAPIFAGVIESVTEGRRPSRRWLVAAALGTLGTVLTCLGRGGDAGQTGDRPLLGILLGLLAGLTYAVYSWVVHRLLGHGIGRAAAMGSVFGLGGLGLLPVLVVTGAPLLASTASLSVAAYMALVPMFAGYLLFGYGLTRVSASTATTITLVEPAVATVLAVTLVGERLGASGWAGLILLGSALVVLTWPPRR